VLVFVNLGRRCGLGLAGGNELKDDQRRKRITSVTVGKADVWSDMGK
jgi:hypothetical protein